MLREWWQSPGIAEPFWRPLRGRTTETMCVAWWPSDGPHYLFGPNSMYQMHEAEPVSVWVVNPSLFQNENRRVLPGVLPVKADHANPNSRFCSSQHDGMLVTSCRVRLVKLDGCSPARMAWMMSGAR